MERAGPGLTAREAAFRLKAEGANELPRGGRATVWTTLGELAREPALLLLIGGTGLYAALGDAADSAMLGAAALGVIVITVVQRRRTERALEALRALASPRALVLRDGRPLRIPGREVVRGDLLLLSEGDRVSADAALLEASDLSVDESLLTGESVPVSKRPWTGEPASPPGGDDQPFVYSGTLVVRGRGLAEVRSTGVRTEMGLIGKALETLEPEQTSLHRETARLVRVLGAGALVVCVATALLYGLRHGAWTQGWLAGLTLALSLVPEEFPVVLTVFLALGAWRMSRRQVLARRAAAVEALGAATVVCTDKTGTLTQNRMAVAQVFPATQELEVLAAAALACAPRTQDPMERAILEAAARAGASAPDGELEREYPLGPVLAMANVWRREGARHGACKGGPEAVARLCGLGPEVSAPLEREVARLARGGLRVLGVARAEPAGGELPEDITGLPMSFVGLVGLADPLKPSAADAVRRCRAAGLRVVLVTGDHEVTAASIARQAGIDAADVVARCVPERKLRLVRELQAKGEVVAMLGDGVNDAPALKAAHIGVAMGGRGTDVAREAAALVLMEDDLGVFVEAVALGRRIFDNLRKAMQYLVAVHVPIAGLTLTCAVLGWPLALLPVHIALLELLIDPACSLAFEAGESEKGAMTRPPRGPGEPLIGREQALRALLQGLGAYGCCLAAFSAVYLGGGGEGRARAAAFVTVILSNVALILSNLSWEGGALAALRQRNLPLRWILAGAAATLAACLCLPPARSLLHFERPAAADLLWAGGLGLLALLWAELARAAPLERS